ncbi:MAG: alpha/beta fold hydrolase [Calditrichaceae bacterium]
MIRKSYTLHNKSNEDLLLDLRYDEGTRDAPGIIIMHGFKGFKDWGFFPNLAGRMTASGYATICFNFSRNGIGSDLNNFTEPDKFANDTYSHQLADAETVLEAVKSGAIGKNIIDPEKLGILGHSRGGAIAILTARNHEDDFQALVTWSSISNLFRYSEEQIKQWEKQGYIEIENARTKQMMRINKTFWDDLNKNRKKYDIIEAVKEVEIPSLFVHGDQDTSVPYSESEALEENCSAYSKRMELIEGANHTYGIKHPFENETDAYETACTLTEHWFDNNFML